MQCRVCGRKVELLEVLHNKEKNVTVQYRTPFIAEKKDVELYRCPQCFHMQIQYTLPDEYYDNYALIDGADEDDSNISHTPITPMVLDYYDEKFKELASYAISNKRVIDIGCGAGILTKRLAQYFEECIGVEPSKAHAEIGKRIGKGEINIINAYFSEQLALEEGGYSAFVSTQVFEHITVINEALEYAKRLLERGGGWTDRSA